MTRKVKVAGLDSNVWEVTSYNDDQIQLSLGDILWETLWGCKNTTELQRLKQETRANRRALLKVSRRDDVDYFGARMFAFGLIRGMQQGTLLGRGAEGSATTAPMLRYPSVVKLLLQNPVASSLEVCDVLDRVKAKLPWPKLLKESEFWIDHARKEEVKAAISNARRDARQSAIDKSLISLVKSIGGEGSIFDDDIFNVKERAVAGQRKK